MRRWVILVIFIGLFLVGCSGESLVTPEERGSPDATVEAAKQGPPERAEANIAESSIGCAFVEGVDGTWGCLIQDPDTPIRYIRHYPDYPKVDIIAPDGHHVTIGEFNNVVQGRLSAQCLNKGTHVNVHLTGLIPHGIYRLWLIFFEYPGFDPGPPPDFSHDIGEGALGPNDQSRNWFKASATGEGQITRFIPAGELSIFGSIGSCAMTDVYEWHVFGAYSFPGQPYGPEIGSPAYFPGTAAEQFVFVLKQPY